MLKIEEITSKKVWDNFLSDPKVVYYPFFQSWNWGEVQKLLGFNIVRHGVFSDKKLVAVSQAVDISARRGHYIHVRHGPVLNPFTPEVLDMLLAHTKEMARQRGASFIRLSPVVEKHLIPMDFIRKRGLIDAPIHSTDAEVTWVLDITKSEEELLKEMRKSHRYLIRKALADKNMKIIKTTESSDIKRFIPLYKYLSKRKHFVPHKGVTEEFEIFKKDNQSLLILIEYAQHGKKKIIAGGLFDFVGSMVIYRHSASNDEYKNIPAMYLLLWEAILEAKKREIKTFNFWGVTTDKDSARHPWQGLSLFKKGFGGEIKEFLHAQDIPLSPLYWKTYAIEYVSKLLKGY